MKKLIVILLFALILAPGGLLKAAFNDFQTNDDVNITISDLSITLILKNSANVESMTVDSGSINLTILAGSSVTVESPDRKSLSTVGFTTASFSCPSSGSSKVVITSPGASTTGSIVPASSVCEGSSGGGSSSGGGGGGGGLPSVITPGNPTISIKEGAVESMVHDVTLTLSAVNATQMIISNREDFIGSAYEAYATTKSWTLASGLGKKTVYVKYKSSTGNESAVASDDIMLLPAPAVKAITASAGGKVGLPDDLVTVNVPAGAVAKTTNVTITPSSVYTAPAGKIKVAGSKVYDLKGDADGAAVKTFSKDLTLTFKYTADDIKGLSEKSLAVHYWDEVSSKWVKVGGTVDLVNKTVTAKVNHFTLFGIFGEESLTAGQLVKLKCDATNKAICTAVYYIGNNGKRYVFPTEKTYYTWYSDFSTVKEISATELASYMIGGNVTYKSGVKMVKITTDPKVYAITKGGVLREIAGELLAKALYGATWNKQIDDLPDPFFIDYKVGAKINVATDYDVAAEKVSSANINADKGL